MAALRDILSNMGNLSIKSFLLTFWHIERDKGKQNQGVQEKQMNSEESVEELLKSITGITLIVIRVNINLFCEQRILLAILPIENISYRTKL